MVGHTGIGGGYKACEAVDTCVQKLLQQLLLMVTTLVIADHGNCETMINPDGVLIQHILRIPYHLF
jgi:2,3-bisphosphoglycerate-independent phosphoglycerate mutase